MTYERLKHLIKQKYKSQYKFAPVVHLSESALSVIIRDRQAFTQQNMINFAKALGIKPSEYYYYFFEEKEKEQ